MRTDRAGTIRLGAFLLVLASILPAGSAAAGPAATVPISIAKERVSSLERMLGDPRASNADLVAAVAGVEESGVSLAPDAAPAGAAGPKDPGAFADEAVAFRRGAERALLRAFSARDTDRKQKGNQRHAVQVRAARALGSCNPRVAAPIREYLEREVFRANPGEIPFPPLYDAIFDSLLRIDGAATFEWLVDVGFTADDMPNSQARLLCALDALRGWKDITGPQRHRAFDRLVQLFQAPDFWNNADYENLSGFRGRSKNNWNFFTGPYWQRVRPTVLESLRRFSTDPRTGLPAFDLDEAVEMEQVGRYLDWFVPHKSVERAPWADALRPSDRVPRPRAAPAYARPAISSTWMLYGVPWEWWWTLERPPRRPREAPTPGATTPGPEPAPPPPADLLRSGPLPPLLRAALQDPAECVRAAAAVAIGKIRPKDAPAQLEMVLDLDSSETVREAATLGLLLLRDPGLRDSFRRRAEDPAENPRVRSLSVLALGWLDDGDWIRRLLAPRPSGAPGNPAAVPIDLQACAVRALGFSPRAADAPFLASLLTDSSIPAAARGQDGPGLRRLADAAILPALLAVLGDRTKGAEKHAVQGAAALAWPGASGAEDRQALSRLEALLASPPTAQVRLSEHGMREPENRFAGVRDILVAGIGSQRGGATHEFLASEYDRCRKDTARFAERGWFLLAFGREGTPEAVEILRKQLDDLDHERDLAACALGLALARDAKSIPALRKRLETSTLEFTGPGMEALGILGDQASIPLIRDLLERRREPAVITGGAFALAALLGDAATPDLLALWDRCRDGSDFDGVSRAFTRALGPKAIEALLAIHSDTHRPPEQRAFALATLGRIADPETTPIVEEFRRNWNPYADAPTLTALARGGDLFFLVDGER